MNARVALAIVGLAALGILSSGCSWYYDAHVVNPCPHKIRIETYDDPPERFDDGPPNRSLFLPPNSTTLVGGAFFNPGGSWSLRIVGVNPPLRVDPDRLEDETIVVPEELCPFAWRPQTP